MRRSQWELWALLLPGNYLRKPPMTDVIVIHMTDVTVIHQVNMWNKKNKKNKKWHLSRAMLENSSVLLALQLDFLNISAIEH